MIPLYKLEMWGGLVGIKLLLDAIVHAWHVVPTFLTFDNSHNSIYFDWRVTKLYNVI